ncbi:sortase, SrtB family [Butyrivibrio sp. M55]|nr:sortase, SrtB family [Butyrivibrio sp. M55]
MFFMKKLMTRTNVMHKIRRYIDIDTIAVKGFFILFIAFCLTGCSKKAANSVGNTGYETSTLPTEQESGFDSVKRLNEDAFAWLYIPDTEINYPILQNAEGDDLFYSDHNEFKEPDANGAIYIEAANLNDMCDFNEVIHGASPADGSRFAGLNNFLDKKYFDEHEYAYVYMEDNSLTYYIIAAYTRDNTRLLEQYDFSYASGCSEFIDEIYNNGDANKIIREGCETGLSPEHFLITLTTDSTIEPGKQTVVVGCLVGDAAGNINREIDYGNEEY